MKQRINLRFPVGRPRLSRMSPEPTLSDLEVAREIARGASWNAVAKRFGISWATVRRAHDKVMDFLRKEFIDDLVRLQVDHSEKLNDIFCEARQAWDASKAEIVRTTTSKKGDSTTTITSHGDPRFLAEARAALGDIRTIWGADAPLKVEHAGELRVAGKTQEQADTELIEHVQSLIKQMQN